MFLRGYTPYEDSPIGRWDEFKTVGGYQRDVAPNIHGKVRGLIYDVSEYWQTYSFVLHDGTGINIPNNSSGIHYGRVTLEVNGNYSYDGY